MPSHAITTTLTDQQLIQLASELEHPVLLLSAGEEQNSRYSIFSAAPTDTCRNYHEFRNKARRTAEDSSQNNDQNLDARPNHFRHGWIGARGFDEECFFAAYYSWSYIHDRLSKSGNLYFSANCPASLKERVLEIIQTDYLAADEETDLKPILKNLHWRTSQSYEKYAESFLRLQKYIQDGDCYQANLTQRFEADDVQLSRSALLKTFLEMSRHSNANFCAFMALNENHHLFSLSPERFIGVSNLQIETKPIKGTVKAQGHLTEAQRNTLLSTKHKAENLMIVDLLRNDLSKVAQLNSVKVPKLFEIESFNNVHHLVSTVTALLAPCFDALDAFDAAFPGGSITGAPKVRAMEIIQELEQHPRRFYCGSAFTLDDSGNFDSSILIRTLEQKDNTLYCWAGGGIVADSELEAEYQESLDKVQHLTGIEQRLDK